MANSCFDLHVSAALSFDGVPHRRGHRRTKSAGSSSSKDFSLYSTMGLYAHHGSMPPRHCTHTRDLFHGPTADVACSSAHEFIKMDRIRHIPDEDARLTPSNCGCCQMVLPIASADIHHTDANENLRDCGILAFRPSCIQRFASIKVFVFLSCILVTLHQALSSGYFNSVITTIEKRFDIPSRVSGAIASTYEVGNLLTIIFVSYLGSSRHIPVWIGKGILVIGVGSCLFALPYFLDHHRPSSPMLISNNKNHTQKLEDNICRISTAAIQNPNLVDRSSHFINPPSVDSDPTVCNEGRSSNGLYIFIFMIAQVLIGCGGTPIFTLGTTYIDDQVKKESSSMYIGCMYSMVAFGLVCGFLLGGFLLAYHEDAIIFGDQEPSIYPGHPQWIGAWWAGFVICGILLMVVALPYFAFPRVLKREKDKLEWEEKGAEVLEWGPPGAQANDTQENKEKQQKYGRAIKDIPASMWRLLCNPVYVITCMGSCMELAIVSGFVVFLPKYLETQFSIGKTQANIFTGGIAIPGACVGIFLGGYFLKRFQMKPKGAIQFVLVFNIICMALYTLLYFLGCDNIRMAGATQPYFNMSEFDTFQVNLTADCNMGCHCSPNHIEPVCGRNGITYFSACHAGCRAEAGSRPTGYSNCACILSNMSLVTHEVMAVPLAKNGPCPQVCQAMIPFMVLLFIMTMVVSITQMPLLMITLRSVEQEERSFALGMQFVIFRLFGYIPSPIMFGNVIDSTCLLWKAHCGKQGGFCLVYDIEDFRLRYIGVCSGLKIASGILFFLDWIFISLRQKKELEQPMTIGGIVSSIISLDRLSTFGWGEANEEAAQPLAREESNQPVTT